MASHIAGMTGEPVNKLVTTKGFLVGMTLPTFSRGKPQTMIFLISTSQVAGITRVINHAWPGMQIFKIFRGQTTPLPLDTLPFPKSSIFKHSFPVVWEQW
jgi:hypothetical protein